MTKTGSIASRRLVMNVDIFCCLHIQTPDDGRKGPKHVAWKYFSKLIDLSNNLNVSVIC
jgi:hypothetical protein